MPKADQVTGSQAAVALVTAVRGRFHDSDNDIAEELDVLLTHYIEDYNPAQLIAMLYTLVVLAANPLDEDELQLFARQLFD
jgi:hypothetical protein